MQSGKNALRARASIRHLLARNEISPNFLIQNVIVKHRIGGDERLPTETPASIGSFVKSLYALGIRCVKLFCVETRRDAFGSIAENADSICGQAIRACKDAEPNMAIAVETCICSATGGPCVILDTESSSINLHMTLQRFSNVASMQANQGADVVCPSSMVGGAVRAVCSRLDSEGFEDVLVLPHVEFVSALYRTYRKDASTENMHTRPMFQIQTEHADQFLEFSRDAVASGAHSLLVQPGLFQLDMLRALKSVVSVPVGLFSVSGEYALFSSQSFNEKMDLLHEYHLSARRAGADFIATYAAFELAQFNLSRGD